MVTVKLLVYSIETENTDNIICVFASTNISKHVGVEGVSETPAKGRKYNSISGGIDQQSSQD